jgi:hypothetical protein
MATTNSKYLTRDQVFRVTLSGLMPLTTHYVYYENNLVASSNIKPVGGSMGDPVKTDRSGQVAFDYYNNGGVVLDTTPFEQAQNLATKLSNPKQITVANISTSVLPANYTTTYLSYASTMVAVNTTTKTTTVAVAAIYQTIETPYIAPPPSSNTWERREGGRDSA